MDDNLSRRDQLVATLKHKSALKQSVYDKTLDVFHQLKEVLHELSNEVNEELEGGDKRIKLEYRDRGKFEAQLQVAGDLLIFSMHSNVFEFEREHVIWKNSYVQKDKLNSYCGIINIYNFLADSFKLNRNNDEGYMIGRIFINREYQYFVEGKRQMYFKHNNFGQGQINAESMKNIIETAISYALEFDLLVPSYDTAKLVTVDQMNTKIENSKIQTGKRLGYKFNSDDI